MNHSHTNCHTHHHGFGHENHSFECTNSIMHDAVSEVLKERVKKIIEEKGGEELDKMANNAAELFLLHAGSINNEYDEFAKAHKEHCSKKK